MVSSALIRTSLRVDFNARARVHPAYQPELKNVTELFLPENKGSRLLL